MVHSLDQESLALLAYAGVLFANVENWTSQLGLVLLITDKSKRVNWIHFRGHKSKQVVLLILGGETHAFVDAFDSGFTFRYDLQTIMDKSIAKRILTASDALQGY